MKLKKQLLWLILTFATIALKAQSVGGTLTAINPTGCNSTNGSITVNPTGGNGSYTYLWSNGSTNSSLSGLGSGTYTVTVYSTVSGEDTIYFEDFDNGHNWTINQITGPEGDVPNQWYVSDDEGGVTPVGCGVANNGNSTLYVGANPIYAVLFSGAAYYAGGLGDNPTTNRASATPIINTVGLYNIRLRFGYIMNGQSATDFASLQYSIGAFPTPITPNVAVTPLCISNQGQWTLYDNLLPAACNNAANLLLGFQWINNSDAVGADPSFAVNDFLVYRNLNGIDSVVLTASLTSSGSLNFNTTNLVVDTASYCQEDGAITGINGMGGTPPYQFQWDSAGTIISNNASIIQLWPGTYHLVITDFAGCTKDTTIVLLGDINPPFQWGAADDTICQGQSTFLQVNGNTSGYSFFWSGGGIPLPVSNSNYQVTPPTTSTYTFTFNDGGQCTESYPVTVVVVGVPLLITPGNQTICSGDTVSFNVSGATFGGYSWTGNNIISGANTSTIIAVPNANSDYIVTWSGGGCSTQDTVNVTINNNAATVNVNISPNDTVCPGTPITLTASANQVGGVYTWSGGDLPAPISGATINVSPNSNQVYFVNWQNGSCNGNASPNISIVNPAIADTNVTQPNCGQNNGSITITPSGVIIPSYSWFLNGSPFGTNAATQNNLAPGLYTIVLNESGLNCGDTILVDLSNISSVLNFTAATFTNVDCFGNNNGNIDIDAFSSSGNIITYSWSHDTQLTSDIASNLSPGVYTVTINDGICSGIDTSITITGPSAALAIQVSTTPDNCQQGLGTATAAVTGGTSPYNIVWSNGDNGQTASGLVGNNSYSVVATDDNGCTADATFSISDNDAPDISGVSDTICVGFSNGVININAVSNTPIVSYAWSHNIFETGTVIDSLSPGNYSVTVTNAAGCSASATFNVSTYNVPSFDLEEDQTIFLGQTVLLQGKINVPYTDVSWFPLVLPNADNPIEAYVKPTDTTVYYLSVIYGEGCEVLDSAIINVNYNDSIRVPNVFTPNNDGFNDLYELYTEGVEKLEITIFDRWGNKVFYSDQIEFKWDGTDMFAGNVPLNTAVFAYIITYKVYGSTEEKVVKGNITLIR